MVDISVFTLNCWGIGCGVSSDRVPRFRAIAQHLAESHYDLVVLQEVWCPSDYQTILDVSREVLPFSHFFDQGIIGSGTCVLSKAPLQDATFHEFSVNGYPHKILHGDWFAGKGLGVCQLDYKGLNIHVFVSHMHAEYNRSSDIYAGHRVMQALEAAQWIRLTSSGADLTVYAGDFNTEPVDVPYQLLRTVVPLSDSWLEANSKENGGQTCMTHYNSYTTPDEHSEFPVGKRIDYIMFTSGRGKVARAVSCTLPLPQRVPQAISSRLGKEVSYSDHEAVTATIRVEDVLGGHGDIGEKAPMPCRERREVLGSALELMVAAQKKTRKDQWGYSLLSFITLAAFVASFFQLVLINHFLIDCLMFVLRLILTLSGLYFALMASVFNRRERHALSACRSSLHLLQSQGGYGTI